jgi:uncharacterized repeat protein (TIGR01451 family)
MMRPPDLAARWRRATSPCGLVLTVLAAALGLQATPALAARWHITMSNQNAYGAAGTRDPETHSARTFTRGSVRNTYTITVTNTGATAAEGKVEVVDQLPQGAHGEPWLVIWQKNGEAFESPPGWECTLTSVGVGARGISCSTEETLEPGHSYAPITLPITVYSQADPPAEYAAEVFNVATVNGAGEEAHTKTEEGRTIITPAVPWGIKSFVASLGAFSGETFTPFTQAGGHPFEYTTELVFNYTPTFSLGGEEEHTTIDPQVGAVRGGPKEVEVDLPPGLVGNIQSVPQCTVKLLATGRCRENTAVGFIQAFAGGTIVNGGEGRVRVIDKPGASQTFSSRVWNLQPSPGHVAELGFVGAGKTPLALEVAVRSGSDYGVNVSASSPTNPTIAGSLVTICQNGVAGVDPNFRCRQPSEGYTRPFMRNATSCTGSPSVTTARASSWYEPQNRATKTIYTGEPQERESLLAESFLQPTGQSLVTGCDALHFDPSIEFKPSAASEGGTSQADEPTGMTFNLTVPQAPEEAQVNTTPALKDVTMTLPAGMTVSPAAAAGLQACTKAQFWPAQSGSEPAEHREPAVPAECPEASQIATAEVFTPLLSGKPTVLARKCVPGDWSGGPWQEGDGPGELVRVNAGGDVLQRLTLSYRWLSDGKEVPGATSAREPEEPDLQCQVRASGPAGSSAALSAPLETASASVSEGGQKTEEAPGWPLPPASLPQPGGGTSVGDTLTCQRGLWAAKPSTAFPTPRFSYSWLRSGEAIAGALGETYTLTEPDQGKVIQCQVVGENEAGAAAVDSAAVVVAPVPSIAPPLPGAPLQGQMYQAQPECSPCSEQDAEEGKQFPLFLQFQDPEGGLVVKLHGVTKADRNTGQLTSVFEEQPEQPFELLTLKLKGGPRAPLANSQSCGPAQTEAFLTPWSVEGQGGLTGEEHVPGFPAKPPATTYSYNVEGCANPMPFTPAFNAGTNGSAATAAGAYTDFGVTFGRKDREQDLAGITIHMPPGLVGRIPAVKLCGEAQANAGTCGPESEIGTAVSLAGAGPDPFPETGRVYLTGPYDGAPFGLSVVTPAVAGPFNLGNVVVRSTITVDPNTAAVTVNTPQLPHIVSGVPIRLREVHVDVNRPGFMLNPTNCNEQQVAASLAGAQGATSQVASGFGIAGCKGLPFKPIFKATTQAHTSKANGASLDVKVTYPPGSYANIAKSVTDLPIQLPSRLTTIQKACVDTVFETNPAACDEGSVIGHAIVHTPVLNQPLIGPAYLISHGNRAFPDLEIVLQGEGVTVVLDGHTDIKKGITKTTFESLPDSPIYSFELILPEGSHSALAANQNLCKPTKTVTVRKRVKVRRKGRTVHVRKKVTKRVAEKLIFPTKLVGQNGAVLKQNTVIGVHGCGPRVKVERTKVKGNHLVVTLNIAAEGTVVISGEGLKTRTLHHLRPGTHRIRVKLTRKGRSLRSHHRRTRVRIRLTADKHVAARVGAAALRVRL